MARILLNDNAIVETAPIVGGEPCIPVSVLQRLRSGIRRIDWDGERYEVRISTQPSK